MKKLLLFFAVLLTALHASAYDYCVDGIYYNLISQQERTCEVTSKADGYISYSGKIVIPSEIEISSAVKLKVIGIDGYAFYNCHGLKTIEIPNTVTYIGQNAFSQSSLRSVVIPNSVTSIGERAFYWSSLESVVIGNSVTRIGDQAFLQCYNLTSLVIPNSVTSIGSQAFWNTNIENYTCDNENFVSYFKGSQKLKNVVIGNSVKKIAMEAFYNCSSLISVEIPNSVTWIDGWAFLGCSSLTSVEIPNSVTGISSYAFQNCTSLRSVVIPNSVTRIGEDAFDYCYSLTSVNITDLAAWCQIEFANYKANPLYYSHNLFLNGELLTDLVIPNSVTKIGNDAFVYCSCLNTLDLGHSLTEIGERAFALCTGITSVDIPNSVTSIGACAFQNCSNMISVGISKTVTKINKGTFYQCTGLTSVEIPNLITDICKQAFDGCSNLKSVVIGKSVTDIEELAFNGCSNLTDITSLNPIPPYIESNTFENVSKLDAIIKVPAGSESAYQSANYWKDFWTIIPIENEQPDEKVCLEPVIELVDGKIFATSETVGATCKTTISSVDIKTVDNNEPIDLTGVYTISSFAHAEGYQNSETVTATLVWVNPTLLDDGVLTMGAKKAVLIRVDGGSVVVCGTEVGERLSLYTLGGEQLCTVTASGSETILPCTMSKGEVVIVKYGDKTVKIKI